MKLESWMRQALEVAREAEASGDVPVGAVVLDENGEFLASGHNRREADADPSAHAEVVALRRAAAKRGKWRLDGCTLVVTLEPCPMCAGALVNARIGRLVFGARDWKAGAAETLYAIPSDPRLNHRMEVRGGVLEEECAAILSSFFEALRAERKQSTTS